MDLFCCKASVLKLWGMLLSVAVLWACADDNNSNAVGPNTQSEISSSSLSSAAESSGNSSSSVSSSSKDSKSGYGKIGKSMTVYGLAQNGPYADSSVVKLTALDESTLESTEQVFMGMVEGGFGGYSVKAESLKSNIARVSVTGKYERSERDRILAGIAAPHKLYRRILVSISERAMRLGSSYAGSFLQDGEKEYGRKMKSFNRSVHRF